MSKKPILKNLKKLNDIKLAQGIDLSTLSFSYRSEAELKELGASTSDFGSYWFNLPDGNSALFKTYNLLKRMGTKNIRIINELLCYQLAKQVYLPCARYEPAHVKNNIGLVSYNFLKSDEYTMSLYEFLKIDDELSNNLADTMQALDIYKENGYVFDEREIFENLYKLIIFDTITMQSDRHASNIHFIFNQNLPEIKLAPSFDNEFAFCVDISQRMFQGEANPDSKDINDLRDEYSLRAKYFTVFEEIRQSKGAFINNVKSICTMAKADKELGKILNTFLRNFSSVKAFELLEKKGYQIPDGYKEYVNNIVSENLDYLKKQLALVNKDDVEYYKEEVIR